jgi:hypothetical protein
MEAYSTAVKEVKTAVNIDGTPVVKHRSDGEGGVGRARIRIFAAAREVGEAVRRELHSVFD